MSSRIRHVSQQKTSLGLELLAAARSVLMIESPPPRTLSVSKTEKENVSLADTFRSPDLDTSYSKGQWHRIAIQAAARAKGELHQKWKELPLTHAFDLQPDGNTLLLGKPMHPCINCIVILCRGSSALPESVRLLAHLHTTSCLVAWCLHSGQHCPTSLTPVWRVVFCMRFYKASDGAPPCHHAAIPLARLCV